MQQVDDPPYLQVGTEVSAKYKGAFCEAKVSEVVRNIKVRVAYKQGLGSGVVSDDDIKAAPGQLRVGAVVEVRHPDRKDYVDATVTKIQDCSQYTVVFDDGDITTLRRTALCLKSGRHFNESETLDQLPLTHPEHFGNPVVGGRRGRRRNHMNDDSSDEDDESDAKEVVNEKEEHIGKVVCVETESKKKDKEKWFPGLVVAPTAQATVRIRVKDEYLVRSFKDGRYYTVPKKEATEFTREAAAKQDGPAVQAALEFLDGDVLPPHWERDALFGLSNSSSENEDEIDSDSSDDEPREEKDRFVAQLYKYMDDRGTPLNKVPSIQNKDVDLYRLFRAVQKRGGYNRVTSQNQWKSIAIRLSFAPVTVSITNLVKQAFKKFLQPYGEFHRKLGCSMLMSPRNSNRSKGRSLVRANSVASPKPQEIIKENVASISKLATLSTSSAALAAASTSAATTTTSASTTNASITEESENTSESSSQDTTNKNKRKSSLGGGPSSVSEKIASVIGGGKVKGLVEKFEEKTLKDEGDVPLSKIKAASSIHKEKEDNKDKEREKEKEREREREREKEKEKEKEKEREKEKEKDKEREREREREKEKEKEKEKDKEKEREKEKEKEKEKDSGSSKDSSGHATRDSSPSGSNVSSKKDKTQRKQSLQIDDKRNKRRKDEIVVEKIDTGDFVVETGDKLKVYYHEKKVTYEAKVIEITLQRGTPMYLVHYTGWNNRYDEWVPRERIAENLTKGSKFKGGRNTGSEKSKENPPKPPSAASLSSMISGLSSGNSGSSSSTASNTHNVSANKTPTAAGKRGRGRSDSMPPRSTTPSSVASNSSRTKSPATSALKKRPQRQTHGNVRRTSANVSDVSMATEDDSDTDSDEPVKRPNRNLKESSKSRKSPGKSKMSISAPNSQSETDDNDDDDEDEVPTSSKSVNQRKGRDYDLSQIRSELKGFETIKSSNELEDSANEVKSEIKDTSIGKIKDEKTEFDSKSSSNSTGSSVILKEQFKSEPKQEPNKRSSTEASSETDSFGDDESQSSDKTTQLENMRKKFQQIINAEKLRSLEKPVALAKISAQTLDNARVVEKIIKERDSEKRQESLKSKTAIKEDQKSSLLKPVKLEADLKAEQSSVKDEEKKSTITLSTETKSNIIQPTRFGTTTSSTTLCATSNKYASVIVEKPMSVVKKLEPSYNKKLDTPKKVCLSESQMIHAAKKFVEPSIHKEILKVEPPAACSPSSTSSTSSSTSSSSSATSSSSGSRFLPDMSKLDISGTSSSTSTSLSSPTTSTSSTSYASAATKDHKQLSSGLNKPPTSPDVYEFKDNEPFQFEIRKSPMVTGSTSSVIASSIGSSLGVSAMTTSSSSQRMKPSTKPDHHIPLPQNPMSSLVNRKKRGSPMKESVIDKSKHLKMEEKTATPSPLVQDAKLLHHSSIPSVSSVVKAQINTLSKVCASTMHAPALPKTMPPTNTPASSASSLLAPVLGSQKHSTEAPSAFDTLRKSPSFNLNILNEELAQTVQETTRVLTDALHTPQPAATISDSNESTPIKNITSVPVSNSNTNAPILQTPPLSAATASQSTQSPKLTTPPTVVQTKPQVGSPFIETRSVFELSFGAGSSGRENKFELENAKVLLSATGGAFDLDPSKLESKPSTSSIADKVLKAISQKKEEEENKKHEAAAAVANSKDKESGSIEKEQRDANIAALPSLTATSTLKSAIESMPQANSFQSVSSLLSEPLKINTDIASGSTTSLLSGPLSSFLANKRTPLTSPEPKMGILESMGGTKDQLTETIQKLECAIQRRTPVTSHPVTPTTPLSTPNPEMFSDDSNDSTDSERRLVIEDVADELTTTATTPVEQKPSPVLLTTESCKPLVTVNLPVKLETSSMIASKIAFAAQHDIPAPIPIKAVTSINKVNSPTTTVPSPIHPSTILSLAATSSLVGKLPGSTTAVIYQSTPKPVMLSNPHTSTTGVTQSTQKSVVVIPTAGGQNAPQNVREIGSDAAGANQTNVIAMHQSSNQHQRTSNSVVLASAGVPIDLPDIPASVVVASSAVPSVMAAAQAAAAALQTPKQIPQKQITQQLFQTTQSQPTSGNMSKSGPPISSAASLTTAPLQSIITTVQSTGPTAFVATAPKPFENSTTIRPIPQTIKPAVTSSSNMPLTSKGGFLPLSTPVTTSTSTSGFYLDPRTELRPDDGLKPLGDIPKPLSSITSVSTLHSHAISKESSTNVMPSAAPMEISSLISDTHNDSINQLRCEETIPGSPASVITGREDSQERTATSLMQDSTGDKDFSTLGDCSKLQASAASATRVGGDGGATNANSSPTDSCSQEDESSEDLKKSLDIESDVSPRKRRRTRKQTESSSVTAEQQQHQQQQTKRRRHLTCSKKNTAGSDSDDNSDNISQRSMIPSSRHNLPQLQQQPLNASGAKPCPYNFLVQLDPSLNPDQCIAILLKQIQDLRKTYNIIKSDLASIDRRRKKLRRREREKKQQQIQSQHQMKVIS